MSALPSGYPNTGCQIAWPSSGRDAWDERWTPAARTRVEDWGSRYRSDASARRAVRFIGAGKACAGMTRQILASRVILIATPDDKIAVVAQELARIGEEELRGRVVLHTSGAMDSGVLDALQTRARRSDRCIRCNRSAESRCHRWKARFLRLKGKRTRSEWRGRSRERSADRPCTSRKQENLVSRGGSDGRRSCARAGGSRHAVASLAWDEPERSRARVVAADAPGSGEFRNVRAARGVDGSALSGDYRVVRAHLDALQESPEEFAQAYDVLSHLAARVLAKDPAGMLAELEKISLEKKPKAEAIGGNA